ncbi:MarR family winged helix-turn-helix transcriptional regulator [Arcanobacterium hippocoleae]|uniref:DNA-binding MarR family transcriptional regulator n=1 Tax=Arcanobacterium hippocoleae TaxID=149017 RepID=A0ABU1T1S1_9ACTO|nr:MarR family transcriptional regulator [Arcanobacterium hippocoleae]MDR6939297.1 DNA-binding MarR family transcriptional regulator [Arcanobacterium hippocoleae]
MKDRQDVPWLNDTEQQAWRNLLRGTALMLERISADLETESQLQINEYDILVNLSEAEDRKMRMSDLADAVVHSRSRLTHTVKRLEKEGLVERCRCNEDRRGIICCLTDAGFARLVAAAPGHVISVREHLFARLQPQEVLELGRLAEKLI